MLPAFGYPNIQKVKEKTKKYKLIYLNRKFSDELSFQKKRTATGADTYNLSKMQKITTIQSIAKRMLARKSNVY